MSNKETNYKSETIHLENCDGIEFMSKIPNNSIDLVLTDPPYIISRDSGMNQHYNQVKKNEAENVKFVKTEEEWEAYKTEKGIVDDDGKKENYMRYGTIYGKKYCVKTDYGHWDSDFTIEKLGEFIAEYIKNYERWHSYYVL